jgi:hypothetical protein
MQALQSKQPFLLTTADLFDRSFELRRPSRCLSQNVEALGNDLALDKVDQFFSSECYNVQEWIHCTYHLRKKLTETDSNQEKIEQCFNIAKRRLFRFSDRLITSRANGLRPLYPQLQGDIPKEELDNKYTFFIQKMFPNNVRVLDCENYESLCIYHLPFLTKLPLILPYVIKQLTLDCTKLMAIMATVGTLLSITAFFIISIFYAPFNVVFKDMCISYPLIGMLFLLITFNGYPLTKLLVFADRSTDYEFTPGITVDFDPNVESIKEYAKQINLTLKKLPFIRMLTNKNGKFSCFKALEEKQARITEQFLKALQPHINKMWVESMCALVSPKTLIKKERN